MKKKIRKPMFFILSILIVAIILGCIPACTSKSPDSSADDAESDIRPKYVAHKGYSRHAVENTEKAFQAAAQMSFYGIETDIRRTHDKAFVCNHDVEVKYADKSVLKIPSHDLDELLAKPLKNDKTSEEVYLCTFETYLAACKAGNKMAVIELKDYCDEDYMQDVLDIIDAKYDRKKVTFISFNFSSLRSVKNLDPTIKLQYLSQKKDDPIFESCLELGVSIDVRVTDVKETILTAALIKTFHDAGLTVNVWTVNQEYDLQRVTQMGVDFVTTDVFSGD